METVFRQEDVSPQFRRVKVQQRVLPTLISSKIFENLTGHLFETEPGDNHIVQLSKLIIGEYLTLRMHHSAKSATLQNKPTTSRNRNTTLTHFAGV